MLLIFGVLLIVLGILSGAVILLAAVGLVAAPPGATLWLAFPGLSLGGFLLMAMLAQPAQVRTVTVVSSAILLLMAMVSIVVLVLSAASILPAPASTLSLWFVLINSVVFGSIGAASYGRNRTA